MIDFFKTLFRPAPPSGTTAKERLRLVLLSDHLSLAPDVVESLKRDLLEVISRYVEIDPRLADVTFEQRESEVAMLANIPITGVRERPKATVYTAAPTSALEPPPPMPAPEPKPIPVEPVAAETEDELEPEPEEIDAPGSVDEQGEPIGSVETGAAPESTPPVPARSANGKPPRRRRRRKKASAPAPIQQSNGLATGSA